MDPVTDITDRHLAYWDGEVAAAITTFAPPDDLPGCAPCTAVVTLSNQPGNEAEMVVRTPWRPSDEDLAALAAGGTVWLSTWGGLPPHMLEVQAP